MNFLRHQNCSPISGYSGRQDLTCVKRPCSITARKTLLIRVEYPAPYPCSHSNTSASSRTAASFFRGTLKLSELLLSQCGDIGKVDLRSVAPLQPFRRALKDSLLSLSQRFVQYKLCAHAGLLHWPG
jgi:hypothetical protein